MDAATNGLLRKIRTRLEEMSPNSHMSGEPGIGGAVNITDIHDDFDRYLYDIVSKLVVEFSMDESGAVSLMRQAADEAAQAGLLPPVPDQGADQATAEWLGKAKSLGFGGYVMRLAMER